MIIEINRKGCVDNGNSCDNSPDDFDLRRNFPFAWLRLLLCLFGFGRFGFGFSLFFGVSRRFSGFRGCGFSGFGLGYPFVCFFCFVCFSF